MDFIDEIKTFTLIVTDYKNAVIKEISERKKLINYKVMSINEFRSSFYFSYDNKTIYSLMKEYNLKYDIALTMIKNMIYLEDKEYKSDKLIKLSNMKKYLIDNNLLKFNKLFKNYLKDKNIIVLSNNINKFDKSMFDSVSKYSNLNYRNLLNPIYEHNSYKFNSLNEEVEFVSIKINELIKNGVSIDKIKITNIDNEYINTMNRVFNFYNLKINYNENIPIISTHIVSKFLNNLTSSKEESLESISEYKDTDIYNKIVSIINEYTFVTNLLDIKEMIIHDLKNTYIKQTKYDSMIEVVDYNSYYFKDDEYVFFMNFNNTSVPTIYKDEDFITDNIKDEVNLDLTVDLNIRSKSVTKDIIKSIKNIFITYKSKSSKETFYPSMLCEEFKETDYEIDGSVTYSTKQDKMKLALALDELYKFGHKTEDLSKLYSNYKIPYKEYDHKYTKIDSNKLHEYLKGKLRLSYSSMNNYNECAFKYYVSNVLKLDIYEETFGAYIGSIFHKVLEKGLLNEINVVDEVNEYINTHERVLSKKEEFYIDKLIVDLEFALKTIKDNMKYTSFDNYMLEKYIEVNKDSTLKVTFNGIIDKVIYKEINGNCVMVLIDYKTYDPVISLDYLDYGLYMQLPVYLYLAKNMEVENVKFGGFYLQRVLNNKVVKDENDLKLNGYSNSDESILSMFDSTYENSHLIKSMKTLKDGSFSKYSKVLSDSEINDVIIKTEEVIDKVIDNIENARFDINPKYIKENVSCKFCKFKDICFKDESDTVYIKIEEPGGEE